MSENQGCDNCKNVYKSKTELPCLECTRNRAIDHYKPMTNADRIRSMTDEELAEFLSEVKYDGIYFSEGQEYPMKSEAWKEWLQAEVDGEK